MMRQRLFFFFCISLFLPAASVPSFLIYNKTDHALRINEEIVLPGNSLRITMKLVRRGPQWDPIDIAYRGADPRFSGLLIQKRPQDVYESLEVQAGSRWQEKTQYPDWGVFSLRGSDPDSDSDLYASGLKRIFGFEIREIK